MANVDIAFGLKRNLYLACGAKLILTNNLHQNVSIFNDIRGEIIGIVYAKGKPSPTSFFYIVVRFNGYRVCVPIVPVDTPWVDGTNIARTQLPAKLCWATTMHRS